MTTLVTTQFMLCNVKRKHIFPQRRSFYCVFYTFIHTSILHNKNAVTLQIYSTKTIKDILILMTFLDRLLVSW